MTTQRERDEIVNAEQILEIADVHLDHGRLDEANACSQLAIAKVLLCIWYKLDHTAPNGFVDVEITRREIF